MLRAVIVAGAGLGVAWLAFALVLLLTKPASSTLRETARVVPDTLRLVRRLAADPRVGRGVRWRLWFLLAYLLSPVDVIPDFVPLIGYADDAFVIGIVLRSVVRRAGADTVRGHWPGTPDGLVALARLCRLPQLPEGS